MNFKRDYKNLRKSSLFFLTNKRKNYENESIREIVFIYL